jgi:ABC-2 type transport system ATP-binding protein
MEQGFSSAAADTEDSTSMVRADSSSTSTAIAIRGISYDYPGRRALDGVSLAIPEACIFGFLGPNGSGKTTLFSILATLRRPIQGTATILGVDLASERARVRELLGVAFQSPAVDPQLTCRENLMHQGRLYGMARRGLPGRTDEVLQRFNLTDRKNDRVATLSGGLQRKLELAKAMLHSPRILLLDEPSTGLDPNARFQMWEDLKQLKAETGVTIVLTTHLMEEADRCDHLAIMNHGRLVGEGSPETLKASVGAEVVYIESTRAEQLQLDIKEQFDLDATRTEQALRLEERDAHRLVPSLVEAFPGAIQSIRVSRPSLEDVFIHMTGKAFAEEEEEGDSK